MENSTVLNGNSIPSCLAFATVYKDFITFLFYIVSTCLQSIFFGLGIVYVMRRDAQRRCRENKEEELRFERAKRDEDLRFKEEQNNQLWREWRKFSEAVNILIQYMGLKRSKTLRRLQMVADSFSKVRILPHINGLDVLRYMIDDEESFQSSELDQLRLDLEPVFVLLNHCWSMCCLGETPHHIKLEMKRIVIELGNIILPFVSEGSRRGIIEECLRDFDCADVPHQHINRQQLKRDLPYVKHIQFGDGKQNYEECKNFAFTIDRFESQVPRDLKELLTELIEDDNSDDYALGFAKKMQDLREDWISKDASDEEMVLKLIHDVRCNIWKAIQEEEGVQLEPGVTDVNTLEAVRREVAELPVTHWLIKRLIGRYTFLYLVKSSIQTFYDNLTSVPIRE